MANKGKGNKKRRVEAESDMDFAKPETIGSAFERVFDMLKSIETSGTTRHSELLDRVDSLHGSLKKLNKRVEVVENNVNQCTNQISHHDKELEAIRIEMRKLNLVFVGIQESPSENLIDIMNTFICDLLELHSDSATIDTVHRIGVVRQGGHRNVRVKFACEGARNMVWNNRKMLRDKKTDFYINEDLPPVTLGRRRQLREEERKARNLGKSTRLLGDRLVIDNINYELNNAGELVQITRKNSQGRRAHPVPVARPSSARPSSSMTPSTTNTLAGTPAFFFATPSQSQTSTDVSQEASP